MSLAGWSFAQLATLFGVAAAVVTVFYLLRMRRREVVVPFVALWDQVSKETESRRLWRRLRRIVSWLIQLLLVALICAALGDPRTEGWFSESRSVAIVLDHSASMAGDVDDEEIRTRMAAARARARAELASLGPNDRVLLITAGTTVRVPAPLSQNPATVLRALEETAVEPGEADLGRALALARNVLADQENPEILVLTDGAVSRSSEAAVRSCTNTEDIACKVTLLAGPAKNVAITAFAARRYPGDREKIEVLVEVQNLGEEAASVVLDVEAERVSVGNKTLALAPGQKLVEVLPALDAARTRLIARLEPDPNDPGSQEALGPNVDDVAYAVVPPLTPVEVSLVTDGGDLFLEAALLTLDDHIRLTGVPVDRVDASDPLIDQADIVIYDIAANPLPDPLPEKNVLVFDPHRLEDSTFPIALDRDVPRPRLTEQARNHPILDGVVFKDVNMSRGTIFDPEPTDTHLVKHLGEPVIVLREKEFALMAVGFDPRQSDLPLRTAFPLLISNVIDYFEQRMAGFVASIALGSDRELTLSELGLGSEDVSRIEVERPDGTTSAIRVQNGRFRLRATVPGIHVLRTLDGDAPGAEVELAVNQASVEASSLVNKLADLPAAAQAPEASEAAPLKQGPLWTTILVIACVLLGVEWLTYHRRKTV